MRRLAVILFAAMLMGGCGDDDDNQQDGSVQADAGQDIATADAPQGDLKQTDTTGTADSQGSEASAVSFASQVQPIFTASCASGNCHGGSNPQAGLDLSASKAFGSLVGVASAQCSSLKRVEAGSVANSYLVQKLEGQGGCFTGQQMPIGGSPLDATKMTMIKSWITAGAPNN